MANTPAAKPTNWFATLSFGELFQAIVFIGGMVVGITKVTASVEHEGELRRLLENRMVEIVADIRKSQTENYARVEQKFAENAQRDKEALATLQAGLDRLAAKVDSVVTSQFTIVQQAQERNIRR